MVHALAGLLDAQPYKDYIIVALLGPADVINIAYLDSTASDTKLTSITSIQKRKVDQNQVRLTLLPYSKSDIAIALDCGDHEVTVYFMNAGMEHTSVRSLLFPNQYHPCVRALPGVIYLHGYQCDAYDFTGRTLSSSNRAYGYSTSAVVMSKNLIAAAHMERGARILVMLYSNKGLISEKWCLIT